ARYQARRSLYQVFPRAPFLLSALSRRQALLLSWQLAHEGRQIQPRVFALDLAVTGKLDHVEQPELHSASLTLQSKQSTLNRTFDDRLVHQEVLPIESLGAGDFTICKTGECRLIERTRVLASMRRAERPAHDVVRCVRSKRCQDAFDVV